MSDQDLSLEELVALASTVRVWVNKKNKRSYREYIGQTGRIFVRVGTYYCPQHISPAFSEEGTVQGYLIAHGNKHIFGVEPIGSFCTVGYIQNLRRYESVNEVIWDIISEVRESDKRYVCAKEELIREAKEIIGSQT